MNILFVCKHNVFRSKVAEAYFNKVNTRPDVKALSAGLIDADELDDQQIALINLGRRLAKDKGITYEHTRKLLSISLIKKQDKIIIVADNVHPIIFKDPLYIGPKNKVLVWDIADVQGDQNDEKRIRDSIKRIMEKVDELVASL